MLARTGLPLILVPKVPVGNVENYRVRRPQIEDYSKLPIRSAIANIPAGIARKSPPDNHFIHTIFCGEF
jgi:hypothetical protein